MILNSALEADGSINLPTRIVHRYPDFIAVITTNRSYNGCRPLNEALRDRIQHAEKMDLPPIDVMVKRAACKTGCENQKMLQIFARVIIRLEQTAKANAIKGVAGMRSYFYWVDSVMHGTDVTEALYHKVIYKITTDNEEISLLEQALREKDLLSELKSIAAYGKGITNGEELEICTDGDFEAEQSMTDNDTPPAVALKRAKDSKGISDVLSESTKQTESAETGEDGTPVYHELSSVGEDKKEEEKSFRKHLNQEARNSVKGSIHEKIGMIVHRPEIKNTQHEEYDKMVAKLRPVIHELTRKTKPLLEYETSVNLLQNKVYGTMFHAEKTASADFKYFSQKTPPEEKPSLAIGVRIDQSSSMNAF